MDDLKRVTVKCKKDNEFEFSRNVEYSCGCEFMIDENDIYAITFPGYDGELEKQYYAICPSCGYINKIDESLMSERGKRIADIENIFEPYLYQKNNLRSELIYLDRVSGRSRTKTL